MPPRKAAPPPRPTTTLILDNGASTIKAGLATSTSPTLIPNGIASDRSRRLYVGSALSTCRDLSDVSIRRPVEKGQIVNWEAQREIWDFEFLRDGAPLHIDPSETRLLLAEQPCGLPALQSNCDQIVFEEYGFASYYRGLAPAMNAWRDVQGIFNTPSETGIGTHVPAEVTLVVDSGYSGTTVTPLLSGRPLQSAIRRLDVGGKVMTNYLTKLISLRHFDMRNDTYIVNEMKEAACFVSTDFKVDLEASWKGTKGERKPAGDVARDYTLPDFHTRMRGVLREHDPTRSKVRSLDTPEDVLTLRNERFSPAELLFSPGDASFSQPGLADLIRQSLGVLPLGLWPGLLANVVVVGGNTLLEGFVPRLQRELLTRFPDECVVRVARPSDPVTSTWEGMKVLANHEAVEGLVVTKAEYEENGAAWVRRKFAGI